MRVYTLHEPDTGELRYIGITRTALSQRVQRHLDKVNDQSHRCNWLNKLKKNRQRPHIRLLYQAQDQEMACMLERFFIASARHMGFRLVNASGGGDGVYSPTVETRRKMSEAAKRKFADPAARVHNVEVQRMAQNRPEVVAKKRAAGLVQKQTDCSTESWKVKHRAGVAASQEKRMASFQNAVTPEFRAKIGALSKARWDDPKYRARVIAAIRASDCGRRKGN